MQYKSKISADVRTTGIEVKEETPTKNLLQEFGKKIKEAKGGFEAKTLKQSLKVEKEKVTIEDVKGLRNPR